MGESGYQVVAKKKGTINRNLLEQEHCAPYEETDHGVLEIGTIVYACYKPTYGALSQDGVAVTFDEEGDYPFFEVPKNSVDWVQKAD